MGIRDIGKQFISILIKKLLPLDYIAQEIETYAGTQFAPEVANALLSLYEEGAFDNLIDTEEL